ncbi:hypothetical protein ACX27_29485 [Nostoc piscinale CENA21]|uniref:GAF domain-containing protein n=1 Tax=Nostoc piscinale CENA21 TaxID=224013 RepID=A0A0M4SQS5_9NOSO|nr:hypothetical protein ACX27_29485 [Nostoc piscinale CENA21]
MQEGLILPISEVYKFYQPSKLSSEAPASTVGYALHGMILCSFLGEVKTGYEFGRLALSLLEKIDAQSMKSMTLDLFGAFIQHQQQALRATLLTFKDGYTSGIETGDFLYAGYNIVGYACNELFAGVEVDALSSELATYNAVLAQMKQESTQIYLDLLLQTLDDPYIMRQQPQSILCCPILHQSKLIGILYLENRRLT